jgi:CO/xanthine dehydrogenase FAD-binding subunit
MALLNEYHRPTTLLDALALLQRRDRRLLALAGGSKLIGQLETRAIKDVDGVVDLAGLGLDTLAVHDGTLHIGATVTLTRLIEYPAAADLATGLLRRAALGEGPVNLRNVATVGGVIAAAEADSEIYAALLALDARVTVQDLAGATTTPLARLGLLSGLVTVVHVPLTPVRGGLARVARTPADRPIVAALAVAGSEGSSVALCGVADRPVLAGVPLDPPSDFKGSAAYRRAVAEVLTQRALAEAQTSQG